MAPPSLCSKEGRGGLIDLCMAQHGDVPLLRLPEAEFALIRTQPVQLAKEGLAAACLRVVAPPVAENVPPD